MNIDPQSRRIAVAVFADGRREIMSGTYDPFEIEMASLREKGLKTLAFYSYGMLVATIYEPVSEETL